MTRTRADKLPASLDGDPICYHRLTAHRRWTLDEVIATARGDFALLSYDERAERDLLEGQETGIDPIDAGAGDGAGIYFNPGSPLDPSKWAGFRAEALRSPGVGFRLSTLRRLGRTTLRPVDLQQFYHSVDRFFDAPGGDYEDPAVFYHQLSDALNAIRALGEKDAVHEAVLAAVDRVGLPPNALGPWERTQAIDAIVDADFEQSFADDDDYDGYPPERQAVIAEWLDETEEKIAEAWAEMPAPEVVFWGGVLPLSEADVVFGADGEWAYRERAGLLGFGRGGWIRG